jgi:hypothetical protein
MATYRFRIMPQGEPYYETEGNGIDWGVAKRNVARREGVSESEICYLSQVNSSSSTFSSMSDVSGGVALVGFILMGWVFISFTPWILMLLGGTTATWIGQKITGKTIDEINDGPSNTKAGALILILMLLGGGFGFMTGNDIQKQFEDVTPQQSTSLTTGTNKVD